MGNLACGCLTRSAAEFMQNPDEKVRRRMIASYIDSLAYSESEESDEEISIQNVNYSQVFGTAR